jgi:3-deoxy-manno-octulosonate cytidylyltransferase (CMP-KDO synthetase)
VNVAIIIPARYQSSRLPGKPMAAVAGRSLIRRMWDIARAVERVTGVWVATDDRRIADHAAGFGASVVMTPAECASGTDRVHAAIQSIHPSPDAVINLQGDAVLTPPWVVQALVDAFHAEPGLDMVTAAVACSWAQLREIEAQKLKSPSSGTMVTMDRFGRALYFSKAIIPYLRNRDESRPPPVHRHIGIYGYAARRLADLAALAPTPLEQAEQLEQLRALENGIPIRVVIVDYLGRTHGSVDSKDDIAFVEAVIAREGELVT